MSRLSMQNNQVLNQDMKTDTQRSLLIVEDDAGLQNQLRWSFEEYNPQIVGDREAAIAAVRRFDPQVVTLDLGLPPDPANVSEGFSTLEEILALNPSIKVIVVTGNDDRENAIKAIAMGAYDFYQKPIEPEVLQIIIDRAYHVHQLEQENLQLQNAGMQSPLDGIIAGSDAMLKVCRTVEKISSTDVTTLILGESGTGKEVIARAIHDLSPRKGERFVAINCAAIPENLLESELFGYEKGAFTGAAKQTIGKIEHANKGTLFLDEIGDLPLPLQAKLLRFLQERVIERLGGRKEIPVDVRIVCATHQNLDTMIKEGTFREDLYYRLSEIVVTLPPLRERSGDAILLARFLMEKFAEQHKKKLKGFTNDALAAIESYPWPGNIRELENKIKRSVIMADGNSITAEDLEIETGDNSLNLPLNLKQARDEAEQITIKRALTHTGSNIAKTAELLGVSRPTLYDLMTKHGLK